MKDKVYIAALVVLVIISGFYLYKKEKAQEAGKNESALSIMGKAETFEGTWKMVKGRNKNADAIIYVLSTKPDEVQAYELVDSDHLRLLDQEMQPITETNLNFTLTKQPAR